MRARALEYGEAAGDAAAALYSNREALAHYEAAAALAGDERGAPRSGSPRSAATSRCASGGSSRRSSCGNGCLGFHGEQGDLEHVAELHRKVGAALAHKGERKRAIEHHQQGINLIKDSEPSLTLVRLYEEAAWLYMQVGDNMLAIYASEKALRLAEGLGEPRAASRAHGIFGRVFGRIGDARQGARESRASRRAGTRVRRGRDGAGAARAGQQPRARRGRLRGAGEHYAEALALAERIGDVPAQIELQSALGELGLSTAATGRRSHASDRRERRARRTRGARRASCACRTTCAAGCAGATATGRSPRGCSSTRSELAEQVGWSEVALSALTGLAVDAARPRRAAGGAEAALDEALAGLRASRPGAAVDPGLRGARAHARARRAARARPERPRRTRERDLQRVHDPAGQAAALEAAGLVGQSFRRPMETLRAGTRRLGAPGRPLDVARCELLVGRRLAEQRREDGADVLEQAAALFDQLGLDHLAARSRQLAVNGVGSR